MINIRELREYLNADPKKDFELELLRASVIAMWEQQTRRKWNYQTGYTVTLNPEIRDIYLYVDLFPIDPDVTDPISGITTYGITLTEWYSIEGEASAVTVEPTDFYVERSRGRIDKLRRTRWRDYVIAKINGGFTVETIAQKMPDVKSVLLAQARFLQTRLSSQKIDVKELHLNRTTTSFLDPDLHPLFKKLAYDFRRRV